jgi:hypothetical protein
MRDFFTKVSETAGEHSSIKKGHSTLDNLSITRNKAKVKRS